jgi:hypothetical protein
MDGARLRTLSRALAVVGGSKASLARLLAIGVDELENYLNGSEAIPQGVFLGALDVVAGGRAGPGTPVRRS